MLAIEMKLINRLIADCSTADLHESEIHIHLDQKPYSYRSLVLTRTNLKS